MMAVFYHKCTNASFDKMIMPDKATAPRYVVQKGTAATLDFAAVTAQASRILKKFDIQLPGLKRQLFKGCAICMAMGITKSFFRI